MKENSHAKEPGEKLYGKNVVIRPENVVINVVITSNYECWKEIFGNQDLVVMCDWNS